MAVTSLSIRPKIGKKASVPAIRFPAAYSTVKLKLMDETGALAGLKIQNQCVSYSFRSETRSNGVSRRAYTAVRRDVELRRANRISGGVDIPRSSSHIKIDLDRVREVDGETMREQERRVCSRSRRAAITNCRFAFLTRIPRNAP